MTHRFTHITFWMTVVILVLTCRILSASSEMNRSGTLLLDLINQYRNAPYAHGITLGYDPLSLEAIGILPDTQFDPYAVDDTLNQAAAAANTHATSSHPVPAPVPIDRYQIAQTGAVLTFSNFISRDTAATLFAENLLKNELNTGDFDFVFASGFSHAGASVDPGVENGLNAWFSTLMIGSSARIKDMQMLNLINQIRAEPELISEYVHADLVTIFKENQQIYSLPTLQFQPLFFDDLLYELSKADVLTPEAVSFNQDHRLTLNTDLGEKTWSGEWFQAMTVAASWKGMTEARPLVNLFSALIYNELAVWPYNAVIFSNHYTEAGAYVFLDPSVPAGAEGESAESEGASVTGPDVEEVASGGSGLVTLCAGSAVPVPPLNSDEESVLETVRIYGLLFLDLDDDALYAPGEELAGETVDVYPLTDENGMPYDNSHVEPAFRVITDHAGHFSLSLEPGRQWVFETWKDEQVSRQTIDIDTDQFVKMSFSPPDLF